MANTKSRKYLLTINNPTDHDLDRQKIIDICMCLDPIYFCISDEIGGKENTPHTHVFIAFKNQRHFSAVQKAFRSVPHFDPCRGSAQENRDYVFKEGKWLEDPKGETNLRETHFEYGELPIEEQGKRNDLEDMFQDIKDGRKPIEIINDNPRLLRYIRQMKEAREMILAQTFSIGDHPKEVTYIYGSTGSGKTRSVYNKYSDVFIASAGSKNPFDNYDGQSVLVLDEFRQDFEISTMLRMLDRYPYQLPARYCDHWACYNKVFITSNWPLKDQYYKVKREDPETYEAWLRRINHVIVMNENERLYYETVEDYLNGKWGIPLDCLDEIERSKENELKLA